jgi:hypothetical protein
MMFGAVNNAGTDFTELDSTNGVETLFVSNSAAGSLAVFGFNAGSGSVGVAGQSPAGYGVAAEGGLAPLVLTPAGAPGPPTTNPHVLGAIFVDRNGALFQCVASGTPGTWVRVGFNPLNPVRILDTRNGTGGIPGPIAAGQTVNLAVGGHNGVPPQASAVVMNATVTATTASSFLTIWPQGVTRPLASNLNWTHGVTIPNLVIVKLGTGGGISIFNDRGTVHLILDLAGFYS